MSPAPSSWISLLQRPIQFFSGVGPKLSPRLEALGIRYGWDAITHFPLKYDFFPKYSGALSQAQVGSFEVEILEASSGQKGAFGAPKTFKFWTRLLSFGSHNPRSSSFLELIFFHKPRLPLIPGSKWVLQGVLEKDKGHPRLVHPPHIVPSSQFCIHHQIRPQYALTHGIRGTTLQKVIQQILEALSVCALPSEWIPNDLLAKKNWPDWVTALKMAHALCPMKHSNPSFEALYEEGSFPPWRERLAFDELLGHQLIFAKEAKIHQISKAPLCVPPPTRMKRLQEALPYALGPSQLQALSEIHQDLSGSVPMRRLLQGEVGSGKTIVALLAALQVIEAGHQACLLVPTEILAHQHMATLRDLFPQESWGVEIVLGKQKKNYEALASGKARLIVGTQALLQDPIEFASLGLVIIDEQQRFGVAQRLNLSQKGHTPHLLFLSATPIPRTFQLALWGHIQVSTLDPRLHAQPVHTYVLSVDKIEELAQWVDLNCLSKGHQAYWVCPFIEESETSPLAGSVEERFKWLDQRFPGKVALLHGRLSSAEKHAIMEDFQGGKYPLLVSTTVIEVGIHAEAATTLILENSERFGLSQLHQLRGRVGRGIWPGWCFFLYTPPLSSLAKDRLSVLRETRDGFKIAQRDWQLRGGGETLGTQQSGLQPYRLANLQSNVSLIPVAHRVVHRWLGEAALSEPSAVEALRTLNILFPASPTGIFSAG